MQNKEEMQKYLMALQKASTAASTPPRSSRETSVFFYHIKQLYLDTKKLLEPERPWWNGDLWEERKFQVEILKIALNEVLKNLYRDDSQLLAHSTFIRNHCSTAFLWSKYNFFYERLSEILRTVESNQINLMLKANINYYKRRAEHFENEISKMVAREAKSLYVTKKIEETPVYIALQEKLTGMSGDDILLGIVKIIRNGVAKEIQAIKSAFAEILNEANQKDKVMRSAFESIRGEFYLNWEILGQFKSRYPKEYEELEGSILNKGFVLTHPKEFQSDRAAAQYLPRVGMLKKSKSADELSTRKEYQASPSIKVSKR